MKVQSHNSYHKRILTDIPSQNDHKYDYFPKIKRILTKRIDKPVCIGKITANNPKLVTKLSNKLVSKERYFLMTEPDESVDALLSKRDYEKEQINDSTWIRKQQSIKMRYNHNQDKCFNGNDNKPNHEITLISKTDTKETTITPQIKNTTDLDSVKTPEELHLLFVELVHKSRIIQKAFDFDNDDYDDQ